MIRTFETEQVLSGRLLFKFEVTKSLVLADGGGTGVELLKSFLVRIHVMTHYSRTVRLSIEEGNLLGRCHVSIYTWALVGMNLIVILVFWFLADDVIVLVLEYCLIREIFLTFVSIVEKFEFVTAVDEIVSTSNVGPISLRNHRFIVYKLVWKLTFHWFVQVYIAFYPYFTLLFRHRSWNLIVRFCVVSSFKTCSF